MDPVLDWAELGGRALARQFPTVRGRDAEAVVEMVRRIGPIQSQTARSPYLALGARMPGVTLAAVSTAYDDFRIVRGSTIRGTVHTSNPEDHALLEVATRIGQRAFWTRTLKPDRTSLEEIWAGWSYATCPATGRRAGTTWPGGPASGCASSTPRSTGSATR